MSAFDLYADADLLAAAQNLGQVVYASQVARPAPGYLSEWSCRIDGARVTVRAKDCRRGGLEAGVSFDLAAAVEGQERRAMCSGILAQFTAFRRDPPSMYDVDVDVLDPLPPAGANGHATRGNGSNGTCI